MRSVSAALNADEEAAAGDDVVVACVVCAALIVLLAMSEWPPTNGALPEEDEEAGVIVVEPDKVDVGAEDAVADSGLELVVVTGDGLVEVALMVELVTGVVLIITGTLELVECAGDNCKIWEGNQRTEYNLT